jgi:hypothetical protein
MVTIVACPPTALPGGGHAAQGTTPDARRYLMLMAMTILATTGAFAAYTYITPFLTEVSRFRRRRPGRCCWFVAWQASSASPPARSSAASCCPASVSAAPHSSVGC